MGLGDIAIGALAGAAGGALNNRAGELNAQAKRSEDERREELLQQKEMRTNQAAERLAGVKSQHNMQEEAQKQKGRVALEGLKNTNAIALESAKGGAGGVKGKFTDFGDGSGGLWDGTNYSVIYDEQTAKANTDRDFEAWKDSAGFFDKAPTPQQEAQMRAQLAMRYPTNPTGAPTGNSQGSGESVGDMMKRVASVNKVKANDNGDTVLPKPIDVDKNNNISRIELPGVGEAQVATPSKEPEQEEKPSKKSENTTQADKKRIKVLSKKINSLEAMGKPVPEKLSKELEELQKRQKAESVEWRKNAVHKAADLLVGEE